MYNQELISIVIPVFCSECSLEELCDAIIKDMTSNDFNFEIIMVNDASPDKSWEVMKRIREKDERIKIVRLSKNFGQHPAILCGMSMAKGDFVITMDDDMQHPPGEIKVLVNAILNDSEADVYVGDYSIKKHSWYRNTGTFLINTLTSKIFKKPKSLKLTSFRILRKHLVDDILKHKTESPRIGQIMLMVTNQIKNVRVEHNPRKYGRSSYSFSKLLKDFLDNVLANSSLPLKFVSYIGFFAFGLSFILAVYYLFRYFYIGIGVAGWTTVVLTLFFFFGLLFLSIGIIGEYLIRILMESKKLPQYLIREKHV